MTGGKATKHIVETIAKVIFLVCAAVAIVAVLSITVYMFAKGTPALAKVGVIDLLFGLYGSRQQQHHLMAFYTLF